MTIYNPYKIMGLCMYAYDDAKIYYACGHSIPRDKNVHICNYMQTNVLYGVLCPDCYTHEIAHQKEITGVGVRTEAYFVRAFLEQYKNELVLEIEKEEERTKKKLWRLREKTVAVLDYMKLFSYSWWFEMYCNEMVSNVQSKDEIQGLEEAKKLACNMVKDAQTMVKELNPKSGRGPIEYEISVKTYSYMLNKYKTEK